MRWQIPLAGAVALTGALALSACGTSNNSASSNSQSHRLNLLSDDASNADNATFEAVYSAQSSGGQNQTITWAQQKPNSLFKVDSSLILTQGPTTYFCSTANICVKEKVASPLTAIRDLYDGKTFAQSIATYTSDTALHAAGVTLNFHDATYGSVKSKCVDITAKNNTATWCVAADTGLLTYWYGAGASFTLTSYTASPPASDFQLPPGAHVISL